jgi:5-formyltetrahydrofolate cyclo-ligase
MAADAIHDAKAELRTTMRRLRRTLDDPSGRAQRIWARVTELPAIGRADRVLVFTSVLGEPDTAPFLRWCAASGKETAVPEDDPDPGWPDVVIVPGLAFTVGGDRLGQGGGWYDRFLAGRRPDCITIGVCFAEQIVDRLDLEPHDVRLDRVVTDS